MLTETVQTHPLRQLTLEEAMECQFRLVDAIFRHFNGLEIIQDGDYGHSFEPELDRPLYTNKVEQTLAAFFDSPEVALIRGAGTGAIRACLMAGLRAGHSVLVHDAPGYPTSEATLEFMSIRPVVADFNRLDVVRRVVADAEPEGALIQHTRNQIDDSNDLAAVIRTIREAHPDCLILVDDNYAAMRVARIGSQMGADLSAFSLFKLLAPSSVGCVVSGSPRGQAVIANIRRLNRSGGMRIQGPEAMAALRALTLTPVALAVQARVVDEAAARLRAGEVQGIRAVYVANTNSRCLIVELELPIARRVLEITPTLGAQRQSVGSESHVEISALFHEAFSYFSPTAFPWLAENGDRLIRINPNRTGPDTIIRVLREAIARVTNV